MEIDLTNKSELIKSFDHPDSPHFIVPSFPVDFQIVIVKFSSIYYTQDDVRVPFSVTVVMSVITPSPPSNRSKAE